MQESDSLFRSPWIIILDLDPKVCRKTRKNQGEIQAFWNEKIKLIISILWGILLQWIKYCFSFNKLFSLFLTWRVQNQVRSGIWIRVSYDDESGKMKLIRPDPIPSTQMLLINVHICIRTQYLVLCTQHMHMYCTCTKYIVLYIVFSLDEHCTMDHGGHIYIQLYS